MKALPSASLLFVFVINYLSCNAVGTAIDAEKNYDRDESLSVVKVTTHTNRDRVELACAPNERVLDFRFTTDDYGYETSFEWQTIGGVFASGPPSNENFADNTAYSFKYCVKVGQQYRLKIKDKMGDGLCCRFGSGTYRVQVGGEILYNSKKARTFTDVGSHSFRVKARPSSQSSNSNMMASSKGDSTGCITVKVKADKHADELSWSIVNRSGDKISSSPTLKALTPVSKQVCLPKGQYEVVMRDKFGDGLCCTSGDGYYTIELDGKEIVKGNGRFQVQRHKIQVKPGYEDGMSARDRDWLVAHNSRRRKYHQEFGASYVPLQWSPQLAAQAKTWADKLLTDCHVSGIKHEKNVGEGENLAKNKGTGSYGRLYPADNILTRWVENERYWGYPRNAHLTQCLWRATKYVGCGESVKHLSGGGTCRFQVCRYARAGNCNMNQHNASIGNNWIKPMMEASSRCGPDCAPEGCY